MKYSRYGGTSQIRIGLHRVGLVDLQEAFQQADASGLRGREEVLPRLLEILSEHNFLRASDREYGDAIWREYLRHRGEDIQHLHTRVGVEVQGEAGEVLDRFLENVDRVFREMEIAADVRVTRPEGEGPFPRLRLGDRVLVTGDRTRVGFRDAVQRSLSDW